FLLHSKPTVVQNCLLVQSPSAKATTLSPWVKPYSDRPFRLARRAIRWRPASIWQGPPWQACLRAPKKQLTHLTTPVRPQPQKNSYTSPSLILALTFIPEPCIRPTACRLCLQATGTI